MKHIILYKRLLMIYEDKKFQNICKYGAENVTILENRKLDKKLEKLYQWYLKEQSSSGGPTNNMIGPKK